MGYYIILFQTTKFQTVIATDTKNTIVVNIYGDRGMKMKYEMARTEVNYPAHIGYVCKNLTNPASSTIAKYPHSGATKDDKNGIMGIQMPDQRDQKGMVPAAADMKSAGV